MKLTTHTLTTRLDDSSVSMETAELIAESMSQLVERTLRILGQRLQDDMRTKFGVNVECEVE